MKPNIKNFTGTVEMRYRVSHETKVNDDATQVNLFFEVYNTLDEDWHCLDAKFGRGKNHKTAMHRALKCAQESWGINLIKEDALKTA